MPANPGNGHRFPLSAEQNSAVENLIPTLGEQNPWWSENPWWSGASELPRHLAPPLERPLAKHLWKRVLAPVFRRHHLILGPRRTGKTTVMYQTVRHLLKQSVSVGRILWCRLDHPDLVTVDLDTLARFAIDRAQATMEKPALLFLDELVYAQDWDLWLKTFHDQAYPVKVIASASATMALKTRHAESGVGRWDEFYLGPCPLSDFPAFHELDGVDREAAKPKAHLHDTIRSLTVASPVVRITEQARRRLMLVGGFPELLMEDLNAPQTSNAGEQTNEERLFFAAQSMLHVNAVERAVYKDILQSYQVENPMMLERLLYILADRVTGLLSPKDICESLSNLTTPTFERYLDALVRSYLVFTLPNYARTEASVQRRGRKLYFTDGAVRNAVLQRGIRTLDDPAEAGKLHENMVAAHLHSLGKQPGIRLYHWRDGQNEVDLVYDDGEHPLVFEIGSRSRHGLSGLKAFLKKHPRFRGGAYYVAPGLGLVSAAPETDHIGRCSLDRLLVAAGLQQERTLMTQLGIAGAGAEQ